MALEQSFTKYLDFSLPVLITTNLHIHLTLPLWCVIQPTSQYNIKTPDLN